MKELGNLDKVETTWLLCIVDLSWQHAPGRITKPDKEYEKAGKTGLFLLVR